MARKDCFHVSGVNSSEGWGTKENLFQGVACLSEMEKKQFHEPRFCVCPENLLEAIDSEGPLILESWWWETPMLPCKNPVSLK
tara:strand:+ start:1181 stop:1429 length:249 start_codon:yes stop_codon:yes gene_type:complete